MRILKSIAGLTRGAGFEEVQCNIYILSRPAYAEVSTSLQELTNIRSISNDRPVIQELNVTT